jgi:hypothetical protein
MYQAKRIAAVCAGVLALSTLASAPSAMANWMVNGASLSGTKALAASTTVHETFRLKGGGVTITCTGLNAVNPRIESATEMATVSKLEFTGCSVTESCEVPTTVGIEPVLVDVTLDGPLALWDTFLPKTKTTFTTIPFTGENCALLGNQTVTGKAKVLDPTGQDERTLQLAKVTVSEASGELKNGSGAVEATGTVLAKLATGEPWSFL